MKQKPLRKPRRARRAKRKLEEWPPKELMLPDTLEEIERGRPTPEVQLLLPLGGRLVAVSDERRPTS